MQLDGLVYSSSASTYAVHLHYADTLWGQDPAARDERMQPTPYIAYGLLS